MSHSFSSDEPLANGSSDDGLAPEIKLGDMLKAAEKDSEPRAATSSRSSSIPSGQGRSLEDEMLESVGEHVDTEDEKERSEKGGVLSLVLIMLANAQNASFFASVGLSGMGAGVIDTFLFIRCR